MTILVIDAPAHRYSGIERDAYGRGDRVCIQPEPEDSPGGDAAMTYINYDSLASS